MHCISPSIARVHARRDNPNSSPSLGRNWWQCAVALILLLAAVNAASSGPSPKVAAYAIGFLIQVLAILNHLVVLPILCKVGRRGRIGGNESTADMV